MSQLETGIMKKQGMFQKTRGATAIEYVLIVAAIAFVIVTVVLLLGERVNMSFTKVDQKMAEAEAGNAAARPGDDVLDTQVKPGLDFGTVREGDAPKTTGDYATDNPTPTVGDATKIHVDEVNGVVYRARTEEDRIEAASDSSDGGEPAAAPGVPTEHVLPGEAK